MRYIPCFFLAVFSVAYAVPPSGFEPYAPEPQGGAWAVVKSATVELHRTDFQLPVAKWRVVSGDRGRLPPGWLELSGEGAEARYGRLIDDGLPLLQWTVAKAGPAAPARAGVKIGRLAAGVSLRISVTTRSATRTPTGLAVLGSDSSAAPVWTRELAPGTGWTKREIDWIVPATIEEATLVLTAAQPGTIDVSELSLQTVDARDLDRALASGGARSLEKNLLRSTRFPLGLPPRWMIDRASSEGDDVQLAADRGAPGPSGVASLRMESARGTRLFGEPFAVLSPAQGHVASLAVRGEGEGTLSVAAGDTVLATRAFSASGEAWQRVILPFTPRGLGDELYLMIEGKGRLWFDSVRVAAGAGADAYATGWPAEVALAAKPASRVVFADEPDAPSVRWAVTGAPAGSRLRAKVVNLYGRQLRLPEIALAGGQDEGEWTLPRFPGQLLGAHRIEAWVEDAAGGRLSPYEEIVVNRLPRPRHWGEDAVDSPFGAHTVTTRAQLLLAKSIGVNWVRFHDGPANRLTGWYFLEKEPGQWKFEDEVVRRYRDQHLMILGQLGTAPAWATALQRVGAYSWTDRYYQPENMEAFRHYVRVVTGRYRAEIRHWDIWNEPWLAGFWKKDRVRDAEGRVKLEVGQDPAGDFARLQRAAFDEARGVDPGLKIVGFNTTGGNHSIPGRKIAGEQWTRQVRDAGGVASSDIISYHQYAYEDAGYPADSMEKGYLMAVRPLLDAHGRAPRPVWLTEGNVVQGWTNKGFYYHSLAFPQEDNDLATADRLGRYLVGALGAGAEKVFLYSMHKYGHFDDGVKYRVLLSEDGFLHPTAIAYAALAWRVEDKRFVKTLELTPDTRAYVFAGKQGWTAVVAPRPGGESTVSLARFAAFAPADLYGNPLPPDAGPGRTLFYLSGQGTFADALLVPRQP